MALGSLLTSRGAVILQTGTGEGGQIIGTYYISFTV